MDGHNIKCTHGLISSCTPENISNNNGVSRSLLVRLFGQVNPVWSQTCEIHNSDKYIKVLKELVNIASVIFSQLTKDSADLESETGSVALATIKDLVVFWASELPIVTSRFCVEAGTEPHDTMVLKATGEAAVALLAETESGNWPSALKNARPRSVDCMSTLVLRNEEPIHLLLHLLYEASLIVNVDDTVLPSVYSSAAILSSSSTGFFESGIWMSIVSFFGARTASGLDHRMVRIASALVGQITASNIQKLPTNVQEMVVALLKSQINWPSGSDEYNIAQDSVSLLVNICTKQKNRYLSIMIAQAFKFFAEANRELLQRCSEPLSKLIADCNTDVRNAWIAAIEPNAIIPQELHNCIFPVLSRHIRASDCGEWKSINYVNTAAENNFSVDDAVLVISYIIDISRDESGIPAHDSCLGFSQLALNVITDLYWISCPQEDKNDQHAECSIYKIIEAVIACTVFKIINDTQQSVIDEIVRLLVSSVSENLSSAKGKDGHAGEKTRGTSRSLYGIYWALECLFHFLSHNTHASPDSSLLLNDRHHQKTLLDAAVLCSNFGFAVFIAKRMLAISKSGMALTSIFDTIQWAFIRELLDRDAGDCIDYLSTMTESNILPNDSPGNVPPNQDIVAQLYSLDLHERSSSNSLLRLSRFYDDSSTSSASNMQSVTSSLDCDSIRRLVENLLPACGKSHLLLTTNCFLDSSLSRSLHLDSSNELVLSNLANVQLLLSPDPGHTTKDRLNAAKWLISSGHASIHPLDLLSISNTRMPFSESNDLWLMMCKELMFTSYNQQNLDDFFSGIAKLNEPAANAVLDAIPKELHADLVFSLLPCDFETSNDVFKLHYISEANIDNSPSTDPLSHTKPYVNTQKAKEMMLYLGNESGIKADFSETCTQCILNSSTLRFTAKGVFDPVSQFVSSIAKNPSFAPEFKADHLTKVAIKNLAPFIPQLFSMLCFPSTDIADAQSSGKSNAKSSAYKILRLLSRSAPDLIVFHAVVAFRSSPQDSESKYMIKELLRYFSTFQVTSINLFLKLIDQAMILPQERLHRICTQVRSAYLRKLSKVSTAAKSSTPHFDDHIDKILEPIFESLNTSLACEPQTPAEVDLHKIIPSLVEQLTQLRSENIKGVTQKHCKEVWASIMSSLQTRISLPVSYASAELVSFDTPIPVPSLTHPHIPRYFAGVDTMMRVIGSKNRPKLLTISFSDDEGAISKDQYILKGSEDIHMDETVMQVFARLNRVLSCASTGKDGDTSDAHNKLATYDVVATGKYGGLIKVVDDVKSLFSLYIRYAKHGLLTKGMSPKHPGSRTQKSAKDTMPPPSTHQLFQQHAAKILSKAGIPLNTPPNKWPKNVALAIYKSLKSTTPPTLLHDQLLKSAVSAAHLHLATRNLVRSVGVASFSGYILGIGDRHLENLLIDIASGQMISIDFNVSFDFGAISKIPERVPFRLTPILQYICGTPATSVNLASTPFSYSSSFSKSAAALLHFARMDKDALVYGIVSQAIFRPFHEWRDIEKFCISTETDTATPSKGSPGNTTTNNKQDSSALTIKNEDNYNDTSWDSSVNIEGTDVPTVPVLDTKTPRHKPTVLQVEESIRATGMAPFNAFVPYGSQYSKTSEAEHGWQIAQAALGRVSARLEFEGDTESDSQAVSKMEIVERQVNALWGAAISEERLCRMFSGWASWI